MELETGNFRSLGFGIWYLETQPVPHTLPVCYDDLFNMDPRDVSMDHEIVIRGARQHNLKEVSLSIPRDRLVVITGLSGSGKSSLAFDTIYAEGQRRYVESLSAYARQFLEQLQKPDVDSIEGLPPTISIEQRAGHATPRSTVATSTEIYDHLRLLFARVGRPSCYKCGRPISQQTPEQIVDAVLGYPQGTKLVLLAPIVRGKKGSHREVFDRIRKEGFVRVRVDGKMEEVRDIITPDKNKKHEIEAVVDRLVLEAGLSRRRLADSVETALKLGEGLMIIAAEGKDRLFSESYACPNSSRGSSRSTAPTAPAPRATGSAPARKSTRTSSSPTGPSRSRTARSSRGASSAGG